MDMNWLQCMSIFMFHLGSRFLVITPTEAQKKILAHPATQMFILFCMFYMSTRNLYLALGMVSIYYIVLYVLTNEDHPLFAIPISWIRDREQQQRQGQGEGQGQGQGQGQEHTKGSNQQKSRGALYLSNMNRIHLGLDGFPQ